MAKIYMIVCKNTQKCYYGSTKSSIENRLVGHVKSFNSWLYRKSQKYCTSFEVLKGDNYEIQEIESCSDDKEEMNFLEAFYITFYNDNCVNKNIPGRTYKEYYNDKKNIFKQRIECACGKDFRADSKFNHNKTKHHQKFMNSIK
jgi:hypothetical protein